MLYRCFYIKLAFFYKFMSSMSGAKLTSENACFQPRNNSIQVKVFAFDFDKTCTTKAILDIYKAREDYGIEKDTLDRKWKSITQFYESVMKEILTPLKETKPMATRFDKEGLRRFLVEIATGDMMAIKYLVQSKILQGITTKGLADFAKNVELMPGVLTVLQSFKSLKLPFHVISLNFSEKLIQYALNREGTLPIELHTNKLQFKNGISTGTMDANFVSALDKEKQFEEIIHNADTENGVTIYIGDSFTDLLALLKADIGIIIGKSKLMLKVCNDFGIRVISLDEWVPEQSNEQKMLFSVSSWDEIRNFVFNN